MPINYAKCLPYKDTWAAPGSALHLALSEGDAKKAKSIYDECEQRARMAQNRESKNEGESTWD